MKNREVVSYLNGKIACCESPREKAYAQLHRKIIESYAIDALREAADCRFSHEEKSHGFCKGSCNPGYQQI